jgi:hypothetical protein
MGDLAKDPARVGDFEALATAAQAARAIHNFLRTGNQQWMSIMKVRGEAT